MQTNVPGTLDILIVRKNGQVAGPYAVTTVKGGNGVIMGSYTRNFAVGAPIDAGIASSSPERRWPAPGYHWSPIADFRLAPGHRQQTGAPPRPDGPRRAFLAGRRPWRKSWLTPREDFRCASLGRSTAFCKHRAAGRGRPASDP
ncbi:MAG: hypothetical protein IPK28_09230 [Devosia sp.]|nr:hypothetical protein [Devosia sp.]